MTTLLKHEWTNQDNIQQAKTNDISVKVLGYVVLHTKEVGNVLCVHTDIKGHFELSTEKVQQLFKTFKCSRTLTCFPHKHYIQEPELAKRLNIMFPDINEPLTFNPLKYYPDITVGIVENWC